MSKSKPTIELNRTHEKAVEVIVSAKPSQLRKVEQALSLHRSGMAIEFVHSITSIPIPVLKMAILIDEASPGDLAQIAVSAAGGE